MKISSEIMFTEGLNNNATMVDAAVPSASLSARLPTFHLRFSGRCTATLFDACVQLCTHAWVQERKEEAHIFLENEGALLQIAFGLQPFLLRPEEKKRTWVPKPRKTIGKMKVQVQKVKMALDQPSGCSFSPLNIPMIRKETIQNLLSNLRSTLFSGCVSTLSSSLSSYEVDDQETYSCSLRLKSSTQEEAVRMQPGSGETHVFFPDSIRDDLIIEVHDSKGKYYGHVFAQVASIAEDQGDKLCWWSIYHEPEHEIVGRLQLNINYSTSPDENSHLKCGSISETMAYDLVLEAAMKVQHFQQRNLKLDGPWKWLLTEFASCNSVSDAYTKLRYLSCIMDVATPTADCLNLVHDLLLPVIMKGRRTLSHLENRILGEIEEQIEQLLALVFENYKSLDESSPLGMMDVFKPATGSAAPALEPAVKLYTLLHDILSPGAQLKLCGYFQFPVIQRPIKRKQGGLPFQLHLAGRWMGRSWAAVKKRSRRHLAETDEYIANNSEGTVMHAQTLTTACQKMKTLCLNIRNEIFTDIEIHNQHLLPSFIDLPNMSSSIYGVELCNRLRAFLIACLPTGLSPPVEELVIATADFQRDLATWNINPGKGGVDAKELFHLYIIIWIQDKRLSLLEPCKLDKIKWSGVKTQHYTTPYVDVMYDRLKETMNEYDFIICRWPEYTFELEIAIADVEEEVMETLEKQYADVLEPLKNRLIPKKFGLKYVQKLAKRSVCSYTVPDELGLLLNSMKRMIDVFCPSIETQLKSRGSCIPGGGNAVPGELLSEVTVMLRTKLRNYLKAVVEKLADNTRVQSATNLKNIIHYSKGPVVESDVRSRMQPLKNQLTKTIDHLHTLFETHVFVTICRGYWDRMGQDVLSFLEKRKEIRSWYKGSRVAVDVLDATFASQMQQWLGNAVQEKDVEPPRSIMEVRLMVCNDTPNHKDCFLSNRGGMESPITSYMMREQVF